MSSFHLRKCLYAHTCICLCGGSHMYSQHACVCFSFCPHPVISLCPSVLSLLPSLFAVQWGEAGPESKVQVCRLADESQRGSFPPTVCKYVVTLIERSSSSQQLSFLLCVCLCARCHSWSSRRLMVLIHTAVQKSHTHDNT